MAGIDDNSDSAPESSSIFDGVPRRGFLKYLSAIFATAALPEVISACATAIESSPLGTQAQDVDFSSVNTIWVTRKADNVSLGIQLSGLTADGSHNLALASGTTAGNAYVALTFPPQHVVEDAIAPGTAASVLSSYASGTSRLVFQVPTTYGVAVDAGGLGSFPYNLQGVLELCAQSTLVVAANAASNAGTTVAVGGPILREHVPEKSFAQARIDRAIAKVSPAASKRVRSRLAGKVNPEITLKHYGTAPVAPQNGETSIELPYRLLISPDETTTFSYSSGPVASPANRTELWSARMALTNPATGKADLSLGGLTARALWTRDYNAIPSAPGAVPPASPENEVKNSALSPTKRDQIVMNTGDMLTDVAPLPISRLMLTPLGGTLDVAANFPVTQSGGLESWIHRITLGRDEFVQTVVVGTLLPFGHTAAVIQINKRCDNPTTGTVGTIYATSYLVIGEPLISYQGLANQTDFNTFPFVAVELTQTKIPVATTVGGSAGWVWDPAGKNPYVGAIGTDHKGRAIKFVTPLIFSPGNANAATAAATLTSAMGIWNGGGKGGPGAFTMEGQRIAFGPPPSPSSPSSSAATDSTSFETQSFSIAINAPSAASSVPVVPWARWIQVSIDAIRHLPASTTSTAAAPSSLATFDYDLTTYAANGFDPTANPKEVFLTLSSGIANNTPGLSFSGDSSRSGALVTPNMNITALSRAQGPIGGSASSLFSSGFSAADFFAGCDPLLFGFVPLMSLLQPLASSMPKIVSQTLSNAEAFLQEAAALYQLASNATAQVAALVTQATSDVAAYKAQIASGLGSGGAALTPAELTALQAAEVAAATAEATLNSYAGLASTIVADAGTAETDVANQAWSALLGTTGMNGDLGKLVTDLSTLLNNVKTLASQASQTNAAGQAAAAAVQYLNAFSTAITTAVASVTSYLGQATEILKDLETLTQGLELPTNLSVSFNWTPSITGIEAAGMMAFVPSSAQALNVSMQVNSAATNGQPAGANITCRLDQFAIAFGSGIPVPSATGGTFQPLEIVTDAGALASGPGSWSIGAAENAADVTLVFDHMQFQCLAGQKPDVDVVFKNIYFGGDLKFIETLKDILPLDAFSDPPFITVDASGITAGFNLAVPNVAIGMFSLENLNLEAALNMPFVSSSGGVNFLLNFSTIDNPFLVTVAMLGGGGFFQMTMDMNGLESVGFGVQVSAQLALSLLDIVSGSASIDVGLFMSYNRLSSGGTDPVTQQPEVQGWTFGGYLRLRGELDVAGLITIALELYLQVTYSASTGKCVASGYIQIDVSLLFFSLHAKIPFSRQFAGSNGDPTFVQTMAPGGVDPMLDPAKGSTTWDPLAEYCMAFA